MLIVNTTQVLTKVIKVITGLHAVCSGLSYSAMVKYFQIMVTSNIANVIIYIT